MGIRGLVFGAKGLKCFPFFSNPHRQTFNLEPSFNALLFLPNNNSFLRRNCSTSASISASLQPPDVPRLAETAQISLSPHEVEEFAPKIRQVIDWFGQLEAVDLQNVEPAIRADTEGGNLRDDVPQTFENRAAMIAGVPNYEEPYIKVPKVLNKEKTPF